MRKPTIPVFGIGILLAAVLLPSPSRERNQRSSVCHDKRTRYLHRYGAGRLHDQPRRPAEHDAVRSPDHRRSRVQLGPEGHGRVPDVPGRHPEVRDRTQVAAGIQLPPSPYPGILYGRLSGNLLHRRSYPRPNVLTSMILTGRISPECWRTQEPHFPRLYHGAISPFLSWARWSQFLPIRFICADHLSGRCICCYLHNNRVWDIQQERRDAD